MVAQTSQVSGRSSEKSFKSWRLLTSYPFVDGDNDDVIARPDVRHAEEQDRHPLNDSFITALQSWSYCTGERGAEHAARQMRRALDLNSMLSIGSPWDKLKFCNFLWVLDIAE